MTGFDSKQRMAADKLQEPAQEPVAWTTMPDAADWDFVSGSKDPNGKLDGKWVPLYTASPAAQPAQELAQEPASYLHTVLSAFGPDAGISLDQKAWSKLHTAIKAALAQPEQEPVARVSGIYGGRFTYDPINRAMVLPIGMALYSSPQENT